MVELTFISIDGVPSPEPDRTSTSLPKWYREASRYFEGTKTSTFKNCMAFFDAMSAGYVLTTPCDIKVLQKEGKPIIEIDSKFQTFITPRGPMDQFKSPEGYHLEHFAFLMQWGISTPKGYSSLCISPLNRFDLPFIVTNGIIDTDNLPTPGNVPFFIREGYEGTIPAGTPYLQVIPFKREEWNAKAIRQPNMLDLRSYRKVGYKLRGVASDYYRNNYWVKKIYRKRAQ